MDKDTRKVLNAAVDQGFTWKPNADGHPMVYKDGAYVTQFSGCRASGFVAGPVAYGDDQQGA